MELVKKITARDLFGDVKKIVLEKCPKEGDEIKLYQVAGTCDGVKSGSSNYGDWIAFTGNIMAINLITGEQKRSGKVFIPEPLQSMLKVALGTHESIEFAYTVGVKRSSKSVTEYEYTLYPHVEVSSNDALDRLASLLPSPDSVGKTPPVVPTEKTTAKKKGTA